MNNNFLGVAELVAALNSDLAREYAAILQYKQHAATLSGEYFAFTNDLLEHADEEAGHATAISDLIVYLGGDPIASAASTFMASDSLPMLKQDLDAEQTAVNEYTARINSAMAIGRPDIASILFPILKDEVHHLNDLRSIVNV